MERRDFLKAGAAGSLGVLMCAGSPIRSQPATTLSSFDASRRSVHTRFGRISYVDDGQGPPAIFLHGWPLNAYHWRDVVSRLNRKRRCIAPDFMGLGHTEVPPDADLSPAAQAEMIISLIDALEESQVDLISNDSGTTVAQLLAARYPKRIRSMLLTNGDVHTNSPPPALVPAIEQARAGRLIDWFDRQLLEPEFAASNDGLGMVYTDPSFFTSELAEAYLRPLVSSPVKRRQCQQYGVAFEPNPLPSIHDRLRSSQIPARILWGTGDPLFPSEWAHWLDECLPKSTGVRLVPGAKLFFTEEFPAIVAEEAERLWSSIA